MEPTEVGPGQEQSPPPETDAAWNIPSHPGLPMRWATMVSTILESCSMLQAPTYVGPGAASALPAKTESRAITLTTMEIRFRMMASLFGRGHLRYPGPDQRVFTTDVRGSRSTLVQRPIKPRAMAVRRTTGIAPQVRTRSQSPRPDKTQRREGSERLGVVIEDVVDKREPRDTV